MRQKYSLAYLKNSKLIIIAIVIVMVFSGITVLASSADNKNTVLINLQVDAENTGEHLFKVLGELEERGYTTTVYVTGSFAKDNGHIIQEIQQNGHEIAFHGWATGEKLETMNYNEQKEILTTSKEMVEIYSEEPVIGFRPQYYSQNEDTSAILDTLGIYYDCGFISGLKYIPGYESYAVPYKVQDHNFYAVPVSSYETPDKIIYLCDLSASRKFNLNATEWSFILNNKFNKSIQNNEPMIVIIHPWVTGNETTGYWRAFNQILDRIENENENIYIDIVTTTELVQYYIGNEEDTKNYIDVLWIAISTNPFLSWLVT